VNDESEKSKWLLSNMSQIELTIGAFILKQAGHDFTMELQNYGSSKIFSLARVFDANYSITLKRNNSVYSDQIK